MDNMGIYIYIDMGIEYVDICLMLYISHTALSEHRVPNSWDSIGFYIFK